MLCSSSRDSTTVSFLSSKYYINAFLVYTCNPEESTLLCYLSTGRTLVSPPILDLDLLLTGMLCGESGKCSLETKRLKWYCAAFSEVSEMHNCYLSFNVGLDYVIARARDICFGKSRSLFIFLSLLLLLILLF